MLVQYTGKPLGVRDESCNKRGVGGEYVRTPSTTRQEIANVLKLAKTPLSVVRHMAANVPEDAQPRDRKQVSNIAEKGRRQQRASNDCAPVPRRNLADEVIADPGEDDGVLFHEGA